MESSRTGEISREKFDASSKYYCSNATGHETSACCSECNVHCQKEENCQIHVWCISSLQTRVDKETVVEKQSCNQKESEKYEDIEEVSKICTNRSRMSEMQTSIGKLHRVCALGDAKWTEEEHQMKACNYIQPMHRNRIDVSEKAMHTLPEVSKQDGSKGLDGSLSMVVNTFVDESIRHNIASSIWCDLPTNSRDPEKLGYFYECIAEFGFNHIIVIGEMLYGLLFLDCYGRVFQWENMEQVLWAMGNSLEDMKLHKDCVVWIVEDGVVYEEKPDDYLKAGKTSSIKGTKNNRSKKKKKRQRNQR